MIQLYALLAIGAFVSSWIVLSILRKRQFASTAFVAMNTALEERYRFVSDWLSEVESIMKGFEVRPGYRMEDYIADIGELNDLATSGDADRDFQLFIDAIFTDAFRRFNRYVEKNTSVPNRKKLSKTLENVKSAEKAAEPHRINLGNAVANYNRTIAKIPNRYIAAVMGLKPKALCSIPEVLPRLLREGGNESD